VGGRRRHGWQRGWDRQDRDRHGRKHISRMCTICVQEKQALAGRACLCGSEIGGASRARTDGLVVANDALSQLSYSPTGRDDGGLPDYFTSVLKITPSASITGVTGGDR